MSEHFCNSPEASAIVVVPPKAACLQTAKPCRNDFFLEEERWAPWIEFMTAIGTRIDEIGTLLREAGRAAGGFLLLGPVGTALGVLTSKGPAARFEFTFPDGSTRQGVIEQSRYGAFRRRVEKIQAYRPGDLTRTIGHACVIILSMIVCSAAMGPLGLIVGPFLIMVFIALRNRRKPGSDVHVQGARLCNCGMPDPR